MTISDVGPQVWMPAFRKCQQLLDELKDGSITLSDVDKHFKGMEGMEAKLETDLKCLFCGINECLKASKDYTWIHKAVARIRDYWRLCDYRKAADSFLELKNALNLTKGDFTDVERISKEVICFSTVCHNCNILYMCSYILVFVGNIFHEGPNAC